MEKKKISIGKIILWILFLPIMATIALWKTDKLNIIVKLILIFLIWILAFSLVGGETSDESPVTTTEQTMSGDITTEEETTTEKETTTEEETTTEKETTTVEETTTPEETDRNERKVYITPTGKKYHYSKDCAGKNAIEKNISEVKKSYDPCKKCVK